MGSLGGATSSGFFDGAIFSWSIWLDAAKALYKSIKQMHKFKAFFINCC